MADLCKTKLCATINGTYSFTNIRDKALVHDKNCYKRKKKIILNTIKSLSILDTTSIKCQNKVKAAVSDKDPWETLGTVPAEESSVWLQPSHCASSLPPCSFNYRALASST